MIVIVLGEKDLYCVSDGLVFKMRIRGGDKQEAKELLEEYKQMVWKDKDLLDKQLRRQDVMQTRLLELLVGINFGGRVDHQ